MKGDVMSHVWIGKFDGTMQCDKESPSIPLGEMREQLARLIGDAAILNAKRTERPMPQLCGLPSGVINAYEITAAGWQLLCDGVAGKQGFFRLDQLEQCSAEQVNVSRLIGTLTASPPHAVRDLVGHPLRVYQSGDGLTRDWRPERCNIETDKESRIVSVWFG
jgi:hypothetical protein